MLNLFESMSESNESITNIKDLGSEFASTMACCEEGACCDPW